MERLTERTASGEVIPRMDLRHIGHRECMERLARYEDTGLYPEEVEGLKEKESPKKPDTCNMTTVCPECEANIKRCYSYCHDCGQHIDWSRR